MPLKTAVLAREWGGRGKLLSKSGTERETAKTLRDFSHSRCTKPQCYRILSRSNVLWLHNEELHDLYCSPTIVRVIKSRIMRWAGPVAQMGEGRDVYWVLVGKPEGK
jgi:hypothetical protein